MHPSYLLILLTKARHEAKSKVIREGKYTDPLPGTVSPMAMVGN